MSNNANGNKLMIFSGIALYCGDTYIAFLNTLHIEIIYTFINAEIKIIWLRSKWQVLLSKP